MEFLIVALLLLLGPALTLRDTWRNSRVRIVPGPHQVLDAEDATRNIVKNATIPIFGGLLLFAWSSVLLSEIQSAEDGLRLISPLVPGGLILASWWIIGHALLTAGRRLKERRLARPAVLTLSELPLAPGRRIHFDFQREVNREFEPATIRAMLSLFVLISRRKKRQEWKLQRELALPERSPRFDGDLVLADWDWEIPVELMPKARYLRGGVPYHLRYRWELKFIAEDRAGVVVDSCFKLPFAFPPDMPRPGGTL
jgi:hypothetical protein